MTNKPTIRIIIHLIDGHTHDHKQVEDVISEHNQLCFFVKENNQIVSYVYNTDKVLFYTMIKNDEGNDETAED